MRILILLAVVSLYPSLSIAGPSVSTGTGDKKVANGCAPRERDPMSYGEETNEDEVAGMGRSRQATEAAAREDFECAQSAM